MKSFIFLIFFYILIPKSLGGTISLFRLENNNNDFYAKDGFCSQNFSLIGLFGQEPNSFKISSLNVVKENLLQIIGNSYYFQISTSCPVGRYIVDSISYKEMSSITNETIPEIIFDCLKPPPNSLNWEIKKNLITTNPPSPNIYFTLKVYNVTKKLYFKQTTQPYPYTILFEGGHITGTTYLARFKLEFSYNLGPKNNFNEFLFVNMSYNSFSNNNIAFNLSSPINEYNSNVCDSISAKRAGGSLISYGIWDTGLFTTCFTIGKTVSKLFLYQILASGNGFEQFQFFKMVGGNETNSQLLSSFLLLEKRFFEFNVTSRVFDFDDHIILTKLNYKTVERIFLGNVPVFLNGSNGLGKTSIRIRDPRSISLEIRTQSNRTNPNYENIRHFKYPYGVGKGRMDDFEYTLNVYYPSVSSLFYYYVTNEVLPYVAIPPANTSKVPMINNIEIYYPRGGDGKKAILKVDLFSNGTGAGLAWMKYCGNIITELDLVNGSIFNGYYEKVINVTFEKTPIVIMGTEGSFIEIDQYYLKNIGEYPFYILKEIPYINAFNNSVNGKSQSLSVTKFEFEAQNVNVDNGFLQTLYFDYIDSAFDIPISFYLLDPIYGDSLIDPMDLDVGQYLKDKNENVFKIQFVIPPRKCSGSLPYIIKVDGVSYSMDYFYSLFGNAANLSVTSTDCDEMPPIIKNITYFQSIIDASGKIFNISGQNQDVELGWTVTIEDRINGLKSAYFRIIGDKDPQPLEFNFTPENGLISGDKYIGEYNIIFKVKPTTAGQTYTFENIILIDNSGHKSQIMDDNYKYQVKNVEIRYSPLSPIYNLDSTTMKYFNFTVKSNNDESDFTPPSLSFFNSSFENFEINTHNRDVSILFYTSDNVGLLYDTHKPIVYLEYYINDITLSSLTNIECNTEIKEKAFDPSTNLTLIAQYEALCSIPYGFSSSKGFILSVFGIVDTSFNFIGYSAYDLDMAGFNSYISTNQTITLPYIENLISSSDRSGESNSLNKNELLLKESNSIDSISSVSSKVSFITIIGKHFGSQPTVSIIDNFNSQVENSIVYSSNSMIIINVEPFNSERLNIIVKDEINKVESNTVGVIVSPLDYSSSSSTPKDKVCLNNCGGLNRGVCIKNVGCRCTSPYSGYDCSSKTVKTQQPPINTTSPDSINIFQVGGSILLKTMVSIVAIREMHSNGSIENIHFFNDTNWISTPISSTNVIYNTKIKKGANQVSNITVVAEWFEKKTLITFAGENFTIESPSLKYTITIDHYPFSNPFNTLELIFKGFIETSKTEGICSCERFSTNYNFNFLELQVGEHSFHLRFLKRAITDNGIVRTISNKVLTDFDQNEKLNSTTPSKRLSFVAIEIPLYKSKIEIDPDFSVLLNSNPASSNSENSKCTPSSSSSISNSLLFGIIIGGTISLFRLENNNDNFYAEDGYCSQKFSLIGLFEQEPTSFDITNLYNFYFKLLQTVGNSSYYQISSSSIVGRLRVDSFSYIEMSSTIFETIPEIIIDCLEAPNPLNWEIKKNLITTSPPSPNIYFTLKVYNVTKKLKPTTDNYPYPYSINFIGGHLIGTTFLAQFKLEFTRLNPLSNIFNESLFVKISYNFFEKTYIEFNLSSPINENNGNVCDSISAKRAGGSIVPKDIWDTGLYTTCFTIGKSVSKLFLYQELDTGNADEPKQFQWFKMVGGNETNSQLLSSFLPLKARIVSLNATSYVFNINNYMISNSYDFPKFSFIMAFDFVFSNSSNGLGKSSLPIRGDPRKVYFEISSASNITKAYKKTTYVKYPYGFGKGKINNFKYILGVYIPSVYSLYYFYFTSSYEGMQHVSIPTPTNFTIEIPMINNIEIYYPRGGDGKRAILQVSLVSIGAGLAWINYCGNIITELDLINGSIYNGYYEKIINVTFEKTPIVIMSTRGEFKIIDQYYLKNIGEYPFYILKEIPYINAFNNSVNGKSQSLSVTKFEFEAQNVNVDNGFLQTLYFDYIDSAYDIPISFYLLDPIYGDSLINPMDLDVGQYLKDKNEKVFKIQFVIPPRKCSGSLPYIIKVDGVSYTMDYFYLLFGNAANLSVISTDCDEMPPIIKNITYFKSTIDASRVYGDTFDISDQVQDVELGWTVTIEDRINGLKSAYFRIIGSKDPLPLEFYFTPEPKNGLISGDKFIGEYNIIFKVKPASPWQIYTFENIILIDNSGHKSQIIDDNFKYGRYDPEIKYSPLSPIYNLDNTTMKYYNFSVDTNNDLTDITPPSLDYFKPSVINLDINTFNRDISFIFNTSDNIGLLYGHKPIVFLEYYINDISLNSLTNIECNTEIKETVIDPSSNLTIKAHYQAFCSIPYGFSSSKGFIVSVFGIVDISFNFNGYSAYDLDIAGFKSYISTKQTITLPSIENLISNSNSSGGSNSLNINKFYLNESNSIDSISPISSEGSFITIIGKHFGFKPTISIIDNFNSQVKNSIVFSSNVLVIIEVIPFNSERLFITVKDEIKKVESNTIKVTVSPLNYSSSSTSKPNDVVCLNNCGGLNRGVCIENVGCRCISPYSGLDCLSKTLKTPQPLMNTTSPDYINSFLVDGNGTILLNTMVSIVAIREMNLNNSFENIHYFKENDWISTTISSTKVIYNTKIKKGANQVSNITVVAEWFEKETQITFAGEIFTINPSSLKYTISIDHYPFSLPLNILELMFKSSLETSKTNDICSSELFRINDNSNYLELQVGEFSLLSKYLKRVIIDNEIVHTISNKLITDFDHNEKLSGTAPSKKLSFVAIQIPSYKSKIEIDPDFSVLLNSNPASSNSDNSICTSSSSSSLSMTIIAVIIVGSVIFSIILILFILTLLPPRYKISMRLFYHKLRKH
ncbi:hypothetical protein ACTFIW_010817 [Dictyostelium discoideum]